MTITTTVRPTRQRLRLLALAGLAMLLPRLASGQIVACDFDIADDLGQQTWGSTIHLTARPGASSDVGTFFIINAANDAQDIDRDGYGPGCDYTALFIAARINLVNLADPTLAIASQNIIVVNLPNELPNGTQAQVQVSVEVPPGTTAGTYRGAIDVRDSVNFAIPGPTRDFLNRDFIYVEVTVVPQRDIEIVAADEPELLDSVVVRGAAGQRASTTFRLANAGNASISNVRLSATDLRSESAVGLVIPAERVSFSTTSFSSVGVSDTARVTVTVDLPRGILNGRYRGTLLVQGEDVEPREIPLIAIVTGTRGILFADNPVRSVNGGIARIAFNGDPGTAYEIGIFDMTGRAVWTDRGTVFPGFGGTAEEPGAGADFAVNYSWPLVNGRGEAIASGMYLVVVQSIVNGERTLAQDKLMVIR